VWGLLSLQDGGGQNGSCSCHPCPSQGAGNHQWHGGLHVQCVVCSRM
jgi:hypothetical protein